MTRRRLLASLLLALLVVGVAIATAGYICLAFADGWLGAAIVSGSVPAYLATSLVTTPRRRPRSHRPA
jgi:hypothetical protein